MDFKFTPEQEQFEKEVYAYLKRNMPPGLEEELHTMAEGEGPIARAFVKKMGLDGWTGIGWPKEYGGQNRTPIEQYIFFDLAMGYFRIPVPVLGLMTVGPALMRVGSDEQKQRFLPPILTGDVSFGIGYTEPEAGTDLFSLKTTAIRDGDNFVINGQKIFTSSGMTVDYLWLAARTNPAARRQHEGISIFLVDARTSGITRQPMDMMCGYGVAQEFFDNVRVPEGVPRGQGEPGRHVHGDPAGPRAHQSGAPFDDRQDDRRYHPVGAICQAKWIESLRRAVGTEQAERTHGRVGSAQGLEPPGGLAADQR